MIRSVISVLAFLVLIIALASCSTSKKDFQSRRGLMLLETSQLGRNKGYYSKHKAKKLDHNYKKIVKKRKYD